MAPPDASILTSTPTESSSHHSQTNPRRESHPTSSAHSPFFTRLDDHTSSSSLTSRPDERQPQQQDTRLLRPHLSDSLPFSSLSSSTPSDAAARTSEPSCPELDSLPRPYTPLRGLPPTILPKITAIAQAPAGAAGAGAGLSSRATPTSSPHGSRGGLEHAAENHASSSQNHSYHHYNHGSSSLSMVARRHLSKLSASVLPPRDPETDSVLSEPCSYSTGAFVASDLWLVQRDVQPAEKALVDKDRRRARAKAAAAARQRVAHTGGSSSVPASAPVSAPSSATVSPSATAERGRLIRSHASAPGPAPGMEYDEDEITEWSGTSGSRRRRRAEIGPHPRAKGDGGGGSASVDGSAPGGMDRTESTPISGVQDVNSSASVGAQLRDVATVDPDTETPSSLLVSQFFSGAVSVSRPARLADRDRSDFCADGTTFQRPLPERAFARRFASSRATAYASSAGGSGALDLSGVVGSSGGSASQLHSSRTLRYSPRTTFERASQSHIPGLKRRVSTVRRVRWWFRRVSHRIRTDQDQP